MSKEKRTRYEASLEKRRAVTKADKNEEVADSTSVRLALLQRVKNGEITLEESQKELAKIKRNAKKNGKLTKQQVWSRS